ncbi:MAG: hypothetical protein ABW007_07775 [Chitinophagaceae bacterium]
MTSKKLTFLSNPWVVGIGTTVLAAGILKLIDVIADTTILSSALILIRNTLEDIGSFFANKYELPLWSVILLILSIPILLFVLFYIISKVPDSKASKEDKAPYRHYTSDIFKGIEFSWIWGFDSEFPNIYGIDAYCPKDTCRLVNRKCPVCETNYTSVNFSNEEIEVLIRYYVQNGEWKTRQKNSPQAKRNTERSKKMFAERVKKKGSA